MKRKHLIPLFLFSLCLTACIPIFPFPGGGSTSSGHSHGSSTSIPGSTSFHPSSSHPTTSGSGSGSLQDLDGGFDITPIGADPVIHAAGSLMEAGDLVSMAIVRHYSKVTIDFNFDNGTSLNFFWSLCVAMNLHASIASGTIYSTGINKRNTFVIVYLGSTAQRGPSALHPASDRTPRTPAHSYPDYLNANQQIRLAHQAKRSPDFSGFPIDLSSRPEIPVQNSEELWWVVQNGCRPVFDVPNTRAEAMYEMAKDVLRYYVNDVMGPFEKLRAIFEWIVSMNDYDDDAAGFDFTGPAFVDNVAFYLEGVFEYNVAVCDGLSKAFALLAGIEGLDACRSWGHPVNEHGGLDAGHAWNYGRTSASAPYYLICGTWGQMNVNVPGIGNAGFCDYTSFMGPRSYFVDAGGSENDFYELAAEGMTISGTPYVPSVWELDKFPAHPGYDYRIDSQAEFNAIIGEALSVCPGPFSFQVEAAPGQDIGALIQNAVNSSLFGTHSVFSGDTSLYAATRVIVVV